MSYQIKSSDVVITIPPQITSQGQPIDNIESLNKILITNYCSNADVFHKANGQIYSMSGIGGNFIQSPEKFLNEDGSRDDTRFYGVDSFSDFDTSESSDIIKNIKFKNFVSADKTFQPSEDNDEELIFTSADLSNLTTSQKNSVISKNCCNPTMPNYNPCFCCLANYKYMLSERALLFHAISTIQNLQSRIIALESA